MKKLENSKVQCKFSVRFNNFNYKLHWIITGYVGWPMTQITLTELSYGVLSNDNWIC